ncbi:DUF3149 domain-containing protein [Brachymonas denitrificans]|jgi:hypothetical protein|uniref:DUF3149 domain-containing protein n=1 Tax=Brachymonas denitrificans DSM 15123 TaxID=1121117 RepID=A0A1H8CVG4_9BURK|nr:DUF3149 domain-containing protein [Brachymonas denitrificans]SEM98872.1 Protein of unknown function [Brachymonas denitrificans DSM 15123]
MDVLMRELFATDIGLLTLFTIGFIVVMAAWLFFFVRKNVARDEAAHASEERKLRT